MNDLPFSFRPRPGMKRAVAALTRLGKVRSWKFVSINESFNVLIAEGLRKVLDALDERIASTRAELLDGLTDTYAEQQAELYQLVEARIAVNLALTVDLSTVPKPRATRWRSLDV